MSPRRPNPKKPSKAPQQLLHDIQRTHASDNDQRSNAFFITLNHRDAYDLLEYVKEEAEQALNNNKITFAAGAYEVGEHTGNPHLHVVIAFTQRIRRTGIVKIFESLTGGNFQLRAPGATWQQSIDYFKYTDNTKRYLNPTFFQIGVVPNDLEREAAGSRAGGEATRDKYAVAMELAKAGKLHLIQPRMLLAYFNTFNTLARMAVAPERTKLCDLFIWGAPGIGKSRWVRSSAATAGLRVYSKPAHTKWFDNYAGEEILLLEDVSTQAGCKEMVDLYKIWTDRYPFTAEVKGSSWKGIRPLMVVMTSNSRMAKIWTNVEEDLAPLQRRIAEHTIGRDPFGQYILNPHISIRNRIEEADAPQLWKNENGFGPLNLGSTLNSPRHSQGSSPSTPDVETGSPLGLDSTAGQRPIAPSSSSSSSPIHRLTTRPILQRSVTNGQAPSTTTQVDWGWTLGDKEVVDLTTPPRHEMDEKTQKLSERMTRPQLRHDQKQRPEEEEEEESWKPTLQTHNLPQKIWDGSRNVTRYDGDDDNETDDEDTMPTWVPPSPESPSHQGLERVTPNAGSSARRRLEFSTQNNQMHADEEFDDFM